MLWNEVEECLGHAFLEKKLNKTLQTLDELTHKRHLDCY